MLEADFVYDTYIEHLLFLSDILEILSKSGDCSVVINYVSKLSEYTLNKFTGTDAEYICRIMIAEIFCFNGMLKEAVECVGEIENEQIISKLGEVILYRVYRNIPDIYYKDGNYNYAIELSEMLDALCKDAFGEKDSRSLSIKNNLANYYGTIGDFDEN